jgi:hypothetical protein
MRVDVILLSMTRRLRIASFLAVLLAVSAGHGAPIRTDRGMRVVVTISWFRADRAQPHVQPADAPPAPALRPALAHVAAARPPLPTRRFSHALFQRPPPNRTGSSAAL